MHDVDFLPIEYRQRHQRRQSQPWQLIVIVMMIGLVAAAAVAQRAGRRRAQNELAALAPAYQTAQQLQKQLAEVQKQLALAEADAELCVYLRHPWPRTQLLAALLTPLPKEVTFQQLQILREPNASAMSGGIRASNESKAEAEKLRSLPPAARDLIKLRAQTDPLRTTVLLTGTTTESAQLHRYLAELDKTDIFDQAELDNVNSVEKKTGDAAVQFRAVLVVQPGYGQPGGPTNHPSNISPAEKQEGRFAPGKSR